MSAYDYQPSVKARHCWTGQKQSVLVVVVVVGMGACDHHPSKNTRGTDVVDVGMGAYDCHPSVKKARHCSKRTETVGHRCCSCRNGC
jgi:hypothetical protein